MTVATALSVCSGVGGMDHGLAQAGWSHAGFCEWDAYRRDVLRARFPGVPVHDDLSSGDFAAWAGRLGPRTRAVGAGLGDGPPHPGGSGVSSACVDLVCGGTPCQDLSVAGRRAGLAGNRSSLYFDFARIVDLVRPRWVLWENVPGAFSSNGGRDFGVVLGTLVDLGYGVAWRLLDSRYFGVPQRRRRVFVVGALVDGDPRAASERAGQVLAVGSRCERHPATRGEAREDVAVASFSGIGSGGPDDNDAQAGRLIADTVRSHPRPGSNSNGNIVAHALTSEGHDASEDGTGRGANLVTYPLDLRNALRTDGRNGVGTPGTGVGEAGSPALTLSQTPQGIAAGESVRRLTPTECERLQGLPDGWTDLGGTPDSKRYAALGDAVTSPVAEWIGRRILAS